MHAAPLFALLRLVFKQGFVGQMHVELDGSCLYTVYGNSSKGAPAAPHPLAPPKAAQSLPGLALLADTAQQGFCLK